METILSFLDPEGNLYLVMNEKCFLDIRGGSKSESNKIVLYFNTKNFPEQREKELRNDNPLKLTLKCQ